MTCLTYLFVEFSQYIKFQWIFQMVFHWIFQPIESAPNALVNWAGGAGMGCGPNNHWPVTSQPTQSRMRKHTRKRSKGRPAIGIARLRQIQRLWIAEPYTEPN